MNALLTPSVDESSPWLGLASFTEETRSFFYGREEEVAELSRRVQRKLLTVLFGQSGLGKTSILRAGLVPLLRDAGYCPVYVRIDYASQAPEPAEQIKQAIARATSRSGEWTQSGVAVAGESLWEFLHHRDDVLRDERGNTLMPLLIFDQFEEIFTLAQSDEFGRARAARFVAELADLVENRAPKAFEELLERDDSAAERFDFARSDYRVLIALREDYLAPLESLKKSMPSIAQNRLRLAPMTGSQAFAAVSLPGRKLVTDEVAAAIVRFVAGGSELPNAEVEPSLLSLICRELNDARIAAGRNEISLDLLEGSHASILSNFYERALADQPAAVRRIIEDDLLTESGFRENVAEENLQRRLVAAGAAPDTLATLVNRRLLRIEERLDIRRVELTHDVLCGVVKGSRDRRHAREAQEAAEKTLLEQKERARATRRALIRARQVAIACSLLAIVAVGAAIYGYIGSQRAQRAEKEAQDTRGHAEQLLGYLTAEFVPELASIGRLDVLSDFTNRQIDYFRALPPRLRGPESIRNGALALIYHADAASGLSNLDVAAADTAEAIELLGELQKAGDKSDATTIALARGYEIRSRALFRRQDPEAMPSASRAAQLLKPLVESHSDAPGLNQLYIECLTSIGYLHSLANEMPSAVAVLNEATERAVALGGRDATDLDMTGAYVQAASWAIGALELVGNIDEARKLGLESLHAVDLALERRPGFRQVLKGKAIIEGSLAYLANDVLDAQEALEYSQRGEDTSLVLYKIDPKYNASINNLGVAYQQTADSYRAVGRLRESIVKRLQAVEAYRIAGGGEFFILNYLGVASGTASFQAEVGDYAGAVKTATLEDSLAPEVRTLEPDGGFLTTASAVVGRIAEADIAYHKADAVTSSRIYDSVLDEVRAIKIKGGNQQFYKDTWTYLTAFNAGRSHYLGGQFARAEEALRLSLQTRVALADATPFDRRENGAIATLLSMAQSRQGKYAEAAQVVAPYVKSQRELAGKNRGNVWVPVELAQLLYAEALTDPQRRDALLKEAAMLIDAAPASLLAMSETQRWRTRIQQARNGK